jgi:hypothetical protein
MSRIIKIENSLQKNELVEYLQAGSYPGELDKEQKRRFKIKVSNLALINDILCFKKEDGRFLRAVFEDETDLVKLILDEDGHPGMTKLIDLIHRKYYGISSSVIMNYVRACDACPSVNSLTTVQDIQINEITRKYDRYIMDCVDLKHDSNQNDGYCWILNVIDTYPVVSKNARISKFFQKSECN